MIRQNVLLTNANKSNVYNLNNDIDLTFPTNLFFKAPQYIELLNMDLNAEINLFGNTNNSCLVIYKNITHLILVEYNTALKTDYQLTLAIKNALNNPRNPNNPNLILPYTGNDLIFDITESSIENVVTNYKIERESFTTAYTITASNICTIDFNHKESIGPIIGFGNGTYYDITEISGTSTQSITAYNYLDVINSSGSTPNLENAGPFPNYNDVNCKMVLYNSKKQIIPNKYKPHDTTISLNIGLGINQYENIGEVLNLIEDQLNEYKDNFTPAANFIVSYDNILQNISIKNITGDKFGIGFDFSNITKERIMYSTNGLNWYKTSSINNNDWRSAAYASINNNDIIIAVAKSGINNRIMKSVNSLTNWINIDSPIDINLTSMTHTKINKLDIYIAISNLGKTNRILLSNDGYNWSYQLSPINSWSSITYGSGLFVAIANDTLTDQIITSSDGINWTTYQSPENNEWNSICYSKELNLFVAIASTGYNRVMISNDGINWSSQSVPNTSMWQSVCWGGREGEKKFVAVSLVMSPNIQIMTSVDGINWINQVSPVSINLNSICWGGTTNNEKFVAVSSDGYFNQIITSVDGINWIIPNLDINVNLKSIIWTPVTNEFMAILDSEINYVVCSHDDGINWQLSYISTSYNWNFIYSTDTYIFGIGKNIGISNDEYKWNIIKFVIDNDWESVCWSPELNLFVAVASSGNGNRIMISNDGSKWVIAYNPEDNNWKSVCWGGPIGQKKFVAVAISGFDNRVMTSIDGINWEIGITPRDNDWESICWSQELNLFVAVSSSGTLNRVMTSTNGIDWTIRATPNNNNWKSVCWGGLTNQKKFVAVASSGNGNRVMTSIDGITWIEQLTPNDNNWTSICWTGINKFIAVASSGIENRIMSSPDGITWNYTDNNIQYSPINSPINMDWNTVIWVEGNINSIISFGESFGNSSGSLHYILGLEQKSYYDLTEIISISQPLIFDNIFADDYVLVCSNIMNNANDLNVIGIGNANNIKSNNIIFAIPLSQSKHFKPSDSSYYRINISSSNFSIGYKNKSFSQTNPNYVKFYLRLLSGRHITCTSQFSMQLSFLF